MDLSIIIVNWNSAEYLKKCLETIYTRAQGFEFEVVVVENGPVGPCEEILRRHFPMVRLIQSDLNLGFSGANNIGVKYCRGRNLLFLNPDTEIIGSALWELLSFLDRTPNAGIAGAKLLNSDLSLQTSCIQCFPSILNQALDSEALRHMFPASKLWGIRSLLNGSSSPGPVDVVAGACLMMKADAFERVGGFNVGYFMYAEDVDLCFAAKQNGWQVYYVPSACVVHHGGRSSDIQTESYFAAIVMRESILKFLRMRRGSFYGTTYRYVIAITALLRVGLLGVLAVIAPELRRKSRTMAFRKWRKVLRWAIGLENWASKLGKETNHENKNDGSARDAYRAAAKS